MIKISPSILAGDLSRIADEVIHAADSGSDMIHLDIMDGHFVPNITFGAQVIKSLRSKTPAFFDAHLMISEPLRYIGSFIGAGADMITVHLEARGDKKEAVRLIKSGSAKAGISIKPATAAEDIFEYLPMLDLVLVMTVEPGFSGQRFISGMLHKIRRIRDYIDAHNLDTDLMVDGGIDPVTAGLAASAGANAFVAGTSVFGAADYKEAISKIRTAAAQGFESAK